MLRIGVLAEDETDCDAAAVLIERINDEVRAGGPKVGVRRAWGKGCARLRVKARAKLKDFVRQGCSAAIVLHDLDRNSRTNCPNDLRSLTQELEGIECPDGLTRLVCVPVEEIEAWFWADEVTVQMVGRGLGKAHPSPHLISDPKRELERLSLGANRKPRYTTNDNADLARALTLDLCEKRCPAFASFRAFVRSAISRSAA